MFKGLIDENTARIIVIRKLVKVRVATTKKNGIEQTTERIIFVSTKCYLACKRHKSKIYDVTKAVFYQKLKIYSLISIV